MISVDEKRIKMIEYVLSLPGGNWPDNRKFNCIYKYKDYEVGFYKYGKESVDFKITRNKIDDRYIDDYIHTDDTFLRGERGVIYRKGDKGFKTRKKHDELQKVNKFDCAPMVLHKNIRLSGEKGGIPESFNDIIINICDDKNNEKLIKKIAKTLNDMSFLKNHIKVDNFYKLDLDLDLEENLLIGEKRIPTAIVLYLLDLIATNEDIKYHAGGYQSTKYPKKTAKTLSSDPNVFLQGRPNNLNTIVHIIAIKLKLVPIDPIINTFLKKSVEPFEGNMNIFD